MAWVTSVVRHATQPSRAVRLTMHGSVTEYAPPDVTMPAGGTMRNSRTKAHSVKARKPTPRVIEDGDARREALDWLADERHWERTLGGVRARSTRP